MPGVHFKLQTDENWYLSVRRLCRIGSGSLNCLRTSSTSSEPLTAQSAETNSRKKVYSQIAVKIYLKIYFVVIQLYATLQIVEKKAVFSA